MVDLSEFKVSNYPDGHKHIVSNKDLHCDETLSVSVHSFDDLFLASQVKAIHPELKHLYIKYMLAGRCDRRFSPGEALDLQIVCNYINGMGFESVSVLRPHSSKTMELLGSTAYVCEETPRLLKTMHDDQVVRGRYCYVIPDAGASEWIKDNEWQLKHYIQGRKHRDPATGRISINFKRQSYSLVSQEIDQVAKEKEDGTQTFIIIDDLCDGGGTFIEIAKKIKEQIPEARIILVVTHAIFSKGFQPFVGFIDFIYCTNSFETFNDAPSFVKQIKV